MRVLAILAVAFAASSTSALAQPSDSVVGTWQMVNEEVFDVATGARVADQSSDRSVGLLVYDDTGHMSVQIDRRAWNPEAGAGGYWGTYTVDPATHIVWLEIEWNSSGNLGRQKREYDLKMTGTRSCSRTSVRGRQRRSPGSRGGGSRRRRPGIRYSGGEN